jgi:hypothetical protein
VATEIILQMMRTYFEILMELDLVAFQLGVLIPPSKEAAKATPIRPMLLVTLCK